MQNVTDHDQVGTVNLSPENVYSTRNRFKHIALIEAYIKINQVK